VVKLLIIQQVKLLKLQQQMVKVQQQQEDLQQVAMKTMLLLVQVETIQL
jgi:hypothetical protein